MANEPSLEHRDLLVETFVQLSDRLVDDFDIIEVLSLLTDRCVELFDAAAAGILLVDSNGKLRAVAASSEEVQIIELFQLQNDEGPCLECFLGGKEVHNEDLSAGNRWPAFSAAAMKDGFQAVYALPLRRGTNILGALNMFRHEPGSINAEDLKAAQALADVACIAMLQDNSSINKEIDPGQLQHAFDSRVTIEQAKGMIAETMNVDLDAAFRQLRGFARRHDHGLTNVANAVVDGKQDIHDLAQV